MYLLSTCEVTHCVYRTKNVVDGEGQRLTDQPNRDKEAAIVFQNIASEAFFLVSLVRGQEANLSHLLGLECLSFVNTKNHLKVIIITFSSPRQLMAT